MKLVLGLARQVLENGSPNLPGLVVSKEFETG